MGTKNNPGEFDCYEAAEPDEPMFVLLGRDPLAPFLVSIWAAVRRGDPEAAEAIFKALWERGQPKLSAFDVRQLNKMSEAMDCSIAMFAWAKAHPR